MGGVQRRFYALEPVAITFGRGHPDVSIWEAREGEVGEARRLILPEVNPDQSPRIHDGVAPGPNFGSERLGVGRMGRRIENLPVGADAPAMQDAGESAAFVSREQE